MYLTECLRANKGIVEANSYNKDFQQFRELTQQVHKEIEQLIFNIRNRTIEAQVTSRFEKVFKLSAGLNELRLTLLKDKKLNNQFWFKTIEGLIESFYEEFADAKLIYDMPENFENPHEQIPTALNRCWAVLDKALGIFHRQDKPKEIAA